MPELKAITVYCGSKPGHDGIYARTAEELGRTMARAGKRLVFGGGNIGLMGMLARTVHAEGGHVTGIIPDFLRAQEVLYDECDEKLITRDMHERKRLLFEKGDAIVALPGGIGTLEELVEMLSWLQLGQHTKPILLFNLKGFWHPFINLLDHMHAEGFMRPGAREAILIADRVEDVIPRLEKAVRTARFIKPAIAEEDVPLDRL